MESESLIKPPKSNGMRSGRIKLQTDESVGEHSTGEHEEVIIVLRGAASILEKDPFPFTTFKATIEAGKIYYVKKNTTHNVVNMTSEELEYIYVVSPC